MVEQTDGLLTHYSEALAELVAALKGIGCYTWRVARVDPQVHLGLPVRRTRLFFSGTLITKVTVRWAETSAMFWCAHQSGGVLAGGGAAGRGSKRSRSAGQLYNDEDVAYAVGRPRSFRPVVKKWGSRARSMCFLPLCPGNYTALPVRPLVPSAPLPCPLRS